MEQTSVIESVSNNIIALIFLSYALGALINVLIVKKTWYKKLSNFNFVGDRTSRLIGILICRKIITNTPLGKFNTKLHFKGKATLEKMQELRKEMTSAEIGHLIAFIFLMILCLIYIIIQKDWIIIISLFVANIFLNFYLVLLQQFNKRRIDRFIKILEQKT